MIRCQDARVSSAPTQPVCAAAPLRAQCAARRRRHLVMTPSSYLERATALVPLLAERAVATEQHRRLLTETVADIKDAGFHRMAQPGRFGGAELPLDEIARVI